MDRCIKPRLRRLTKIEAAKSQIESAIWLWFIHGDIVSVGTLATAAHRALSEVAALREMSAWPVTAAYFPGRDAEEADPLSEDGATYFQHAKKRESYDVSEQWAELQLFDAVMAYGNLTDERSCSALMSTFVVRFGVERQDLFVPQAFSLLERRISTAFNLERLQRLSRIDFLKEFLGYLGPATAAG